MCTSSTPAGPTQGGAGAWAKGGALTERTLSAPIADPVGVAYDPRTGGLLVVDASLDRLVSVDAGAGLIRELVTRLTPVHTHDFASVDVRPDGREITTEILGIDAPPGGAYACLAGSVAQRYGTAILGNPPANNQVLGMCLGRGSPLG